MLVVEKPAGMPVLAERRGPRGAPRQFDPSRPTDLLAALKQKRRNAKRLLAVSRLDPDASGLVVFCKDDTDFDALKTEFARSRADQFFTAVLMGELAEPQGTIRAALVVPKRGPVRVHEHGDGATDRDIMEAVTHYRTLHAGNGRTLVRLRLETNRREQPRAHAAGLGTPVLGDRAHPAGRTPEGNPIHRLALHASEVSFTHPATGERCRVSSPAPQAFYELVGAPAPERATEAEAERRQDGEKPKAPTSWERVAEWYDELVDERRSDHYDEVIVPGTLGLLSIKPGERVLDIACGQGILSRELVGLGAQVVGIDAAPTLVEAAQKRTPPEQADNARFETGDARALDESLGQFDAAAVVMALMNIDDLDAAMRSASARLRPGGRLVAVILHPAFRAPGRTRWGWLERDGEAVQFRRVDSYLSEGSREIIMNPGAAAKGETEVKTTTFNRPIAAYAGACARAGLMIDAIEEWASTRQSEQGPRAAAENLARREIPLFLAIRAIRPA